MLNNLTHYYLNLNPKIKHLIQIGFIFSYIIISLSCFILVTYILLFKSVPLYYIGIQLFKLGGIYLVAFLCFGFAFNKILFEP